MVTHEMPLDHYLNRLIAAVESLVDEVKEHRDVLDSMFGQQMQSEENRQLHEEELVNAVLNITDAIEGRGE